MTAIGLLAAGLLLMNTASVIHFDGWNEAFWSLVLFCDWLRDVMRGRKP